MKKIILFLSLVLASVISYSQVTSDFSSDSEIWTAPNSLAGVTHNTTGGNPTGFITATPTFNRIAAAFYFTAPAKFLGDLSSYYNGTFTFDLQQGPAGTSTIQAEVIITNAAAGTLYYFPPSAFVPATAPAWTSYSILLNELSGSWKTSNNNTGAAASQAQVQAILANVTSFQIRGRFNTTFSPPATGLDNVFIRPFITTQPTPAIVCDGATATLTAVATGNSGITYQWQKRAPVVVAIVYNNVVDGGGYSGATTSTLNINTAGGFGSGTYQCFISGVGANSFPSNAAGVGINPLPPAPTVTGNSSCGSASLTLVAFGAKSGEYRWYNVLNGGIAISGEVNSSYTTPLLSSTATYYVAIDNGTCESLRTPVVATINTIPTAPSVTSNFGCGTSTVALNASGGTNGQYRWYTVATGGTAIAGEVNSNYVTPSLTSTTTYYVSISNVACESARTAVIATIIAIPAPPSVTSNFGCGTSTVALNASGGTNGQYRWYTVATGGTAMVAQMNSSYTTPLLSSTTVYYVSINNGLCEGTRTPVTATINPLPAQPSATGQLFCSGFSAKLNASGGTNGQYKWYTAATGGTAISGEVNNSYTTPALTANFTYYVTLVSGGCESLRTPVVATLNTTCVPPIITAKSLATPIGGKITLNLVPLIKTANNNLDLTSLLIIAPPSSGGKASIDAAGVLTIDYKGINFSGTENISIKVCDLNNNCAQQAFSIDVAGAVVVYNAVSPNGDAKNPIFRLEFIDTLSPKNQVMIYNRWGDEVFSIADYDNKTRVFAGLTNDGGKLPVGTYFYKVSLLAMGKTLTGYLEIKY